MVELNWEGKYDSGGRRVAPPRISLPFQTVETVNESAQERQRSLDFFAAERPADWRNRLIWSDKKYVLPALLDEFAGKVNLIYIDPPFATGQDFSQPISIDDAAFVKEPSMIEVKAYRDTWGAGLDSYIEWLYGMASYFHDLLAETGTLYVHVDPGVSHLVKTLLDEVFDLTNFRNEIIWKRTTGKSLQSRRLPNNHDTLLVYQRSDATPWYPQTEEHDPSYIEQKYPYVEEGTGRRYGLWDLTNPNRNRPNLTYEFLGVTKVWRWTKNRMQEAYDAGLVVQPRPGGVPRLKRYLAEDASKALGDVWTDIPPVNSQALERVGYPTQKPVALLKRILQLSTVEGDLILDCVCGSGTAAVAAEALNRRWIACDLGRFAIHTTRKRLLSMTDVRPFVVQNLGKYERQLWQAAEFGESAASRTVAYRAFILDLYHATPVAGYTWLHGLKQGRMVHVGTVDSPVTVGDVKQIVAEFRKTIGTGETAPKEQSVDILGWDFAFELNEIARQDAERAGIELRLVRIPREVLDKRAVEQGDVRFFELAALSVNMQHSEQQITLSIDNFVIPLDDVPADIQKAVSHWSQWIDYWAVDWDNKDDTFHNEWQTYRTRDSKNLALSTEHDYSAPGEYTVMVKVIDILGNDTTKTLSVKVAGHGAT
jgi:adenine-specific DNA-methyltransferase